MTSLLTIEDLSEMFRMSVKSIYNIRAGADKTKFPPAIKIGGKLRFHPDDVDAWLAAQREQTNVTPITQARRQA